LGLLGTEGKDFGISNYYCSECPLGQFKIKTIKFRVGANSIVRAALQSNADIDFDVKQYLSEKQFKPLKSCIREDIEEGEAANKMISCSLQPYTYVVFLKNNDYEEGAEAIANLKIEIIEEVVGDQMKKQRQGSSLPTSAASILREKQKGEGTKDAAFLIGNAFQFKYTDKEALTPYSPKGPIFSTTTSQASFAHSLPFKVESDMAEVYASVTDFTETGLYLQIYKGEKLLAASYATKYQQVVDPIQLRKGSYELHIRTDSASVQTNSY